MKALQYAEFGDPQDVLKLVDIPQPELTNPDDIRIHVTAVGLNPMDWLLVGNEMMAKQFKITLPAVFSYDFAGVVDTVGENVKNYKSGDRVFGTTYGGAAAEYIVIQDGVQNPGHLFHTPDGLSDETASTLCVCGMTAAVALHTLNLTADDTLLIGGAAGGVGVFAVQLAKLVGAKVYGTCSPSTFDFLKNLGAEPIAYGDGLEDRIANLGITAVTDLYSHDTLQAGLKIGIKPEKMSTVIMMPEPPAGIKRATGGSADPSDMVHILSALTDHKLTVPIASCCPLEAYQEAIKLQMSRHTHGKIVITL